MYIVNFTVHQQGKIVRTHHFFRAGDAGEGVRSFGEQKRGWEWEERVPNWKLNPLSVHTN